MISPPSKSVFCRTGKTKKVLEFSNWLKSLQCDETASAWQPARLACFVREVIGLNGCEESKMSEKSGERWSLMKGRGAVVKETRNLWRVIRAGRWMEGEIGRWAVRSMEGADLLTWRGSER